MSFSLIDFLPEYPSVDDPDFIPSLTRKKEFWDLRLSRVEERPAVKGDLLRHQEMFRRFFSATTPYSSCLVFHALGSGKTLTSIAVAENFRSTNPFPADTKWKPAAPLASGKPRRSALVFVQSAAMIQTYAREIAELCVSGNYQPKGEMTAAARQIRLTKEIKKTYQIVSWGIFLKKIEKLDDATIRSLFSQRVIIIDEAHHLRIQPRKKDGEDGSKKLYNAMYRFLHAVEDCRILLLTGTPIWDQAREIAALMNLITPIQLPTEGKFDATFFRSNTLIHSERLIEAWRGRVSYLRPTVSVAARLEMGTTIPWTSHVRVVPDVMSPFQATAVRKVWRTEKNGKVDEDVEEDTILRKSRESSNFVFADGTYGSEGFNQHCKHALVQSKMKAGRLEKVTTVTYRLDAETRASLLLPNGSGSIDALRKYSAKFAAIIDDILAHPGQLIFVTGESVTGSGAILFGLILSLFGFSPTPSPSKIRGIPGKRYAIVSSDPQTLSTPKEIEEALTVLNSPENATGAFISVLIGTRKISEGFTFRNIRRVHVMMPAFNLPSTEQAIGRSLRFGSHDVLSLENRNVSIFRHLAVFSIPAGDVLPDEDLSPDVHIIRLAENKEYRNTQIYRLLKKAAWDCALNYERNVAAEDVPGTRECDYADDCNFICDGYPEELITTTEPLEGKPTGVWKYSPGKLDTTTYHLFYAGPDIEKVSTEILKLFETEDRLSLTQLRTKLEKNDALIVRALDNLIDRRAPILRNGNPTFIHEHGNVYYLDVSPSFDSSILDGAIVSMPTQLIETSLEQLLDEELVVEDLEVVKAFCTSPTKASLKALSQKSQITLLEFAVEATEKNLYHKLRQLQALNAILLHQDKSLYRLEGGNFAHLLFVEKFAGLSYNVSLQGLKPTGKTRLYRASTGKWESLVDEETERRILDDIKRIQTSYIHVEDSGVLRGTLSAKDNKFRLITAKGGRGIVCTSLKLGELRQAAATLDFESLGKGVAPASIDDLRSSQGIEFFEPLEDKSPTQLSGIAILLKFNKGQLCEWIQSTLAAADRITGI